MITRIAFQLTDDERRTISGRRRLATRKEIIEFAQRLLAAALDPDMATASTIVVDDVGPSQKTFVIDRTRMNCTTLDHLYPLGPKTAETPCYCGQRKWGG